MPAAILDTNAISDLMRDHPQIKANIAKHADPIVTSAVVIGEIRYGLDRLPPSKKRIDLEARAGAILAAVTIEPITESIAQTYGRLKASLEGQGLRVDDNDLWIGATALASASVLITRDRVFSHVPGLLVADWSI
jgi:predicted nucleic acid-binding protein